MVLISSNDWLATNQPTQPLNTMLGVLFICLECQAVNPRGSSGDVLNTVRGEQNITSYFVSVQNPQRTQLMWERLIPMVTTAVEGMILLSVWKSKPVVSSKLQFLSFFFLNNKTWSLLLLVTISEIKTKLSVVKKGICSLFYTCCFCRRSSYRTGQDINNCPTCQKTACIIYR